MEHDYSDNGSCQCKPELVQPHKEEEGHPQRYSFGWRHHYPDHVCRCPLCQPDSFMRMDDPTWVVEQATGVHPLSISLDGKKLPSVLQFREGRDGWALFLTQDGPGDIHICERCFQAACQQLLQGHVTVEWGAEVPA